jgi:hypothetical protein
VLVECLRCNHTQAATLHGVCVRSCPAATRVCLVSAPITTATRSSSLCTSRTCARTRSVARALSSNRTAAQRSHKRTRQSNHLHSFESCLKEPKMILHCPTLWSATTKHTPYAFTKRLFINSCDKCIEFSARHRTQPYHASHATRVHTYAPGAHSSCADAACCRTFDVSAGVVSDRNNDVISCNSMSYRRSG